MQADVEQSIYENLQQILLVQRGERVYRPQVGSDLHRLLFEPNTPVTRALIQEEVKRAIRSQEKRIQVQDVQVTFKESTISLLILYRKQGALRTVTIEVRRAG
jgi:phage baseplate assembly protein W